MSEPPKIRPVIHAAELASATEFEFHHPLNPDSEAHAKIIDGKSLSELAGLRRIAVHLVRLPPGKESFVYHSHEAEEEFLYILSGRGTAEVNDQTYEVGAGDFLGFAAPGCAHHLRNSGTDDLVYLMGGERREMEVADFPRLKKRLIRVRGEGQVVDWEHLSTIWKDSG